MTLTEKLQTIEGNLKLLRLAVGAAIEGRQTWRETRFYYGCVRKSLRSIQTAIHNAAKKERKAMARAAMEQRDSSDR